VYLVLRGAVAEQAQLDGADGVADRVGDQFTGDRFGGERQAVEAPGGKPVGDRDPHAGDDRRVAERLPPGQSRTGAPAHAKGCRQSAKCARPATWTGASAAPDHSRAAAHPFLRVTERDSHAHVGSRTPLLGLR
jgi:hypothetical protein